MLLLGGGGLGVGEGVILREKPSGIDGIFSS